MDGLGREMGLLEAYRLYCSRITAEKQQQERQQQASRDLGSNSLHGSSASTARPKSGLSSFGGFPAGTGVMV